MSVPFVAIVVLTHNEAINLPALIDSLAGLPWPLFVIDSGSNDDTVALATAAGATVLTHAFETHTSQWTWALEHLPARPEWVLGLDADHRLSPELRTALQRLFTEERESLSDVEGVYICRRQMFRGTWIRHGTYYPKFLLKLFRPDRVHFDAHDLVDHHFFVSGRTRRIAGDLIEENRKENDLTFWIEKHARYAALHAREEEARRSGAAPWMLEASLSGTADQRTIWIKRLWHRLPLYTRPFVYFGYRYVARLGFLDGKQGFIFHFLHAFWYRLLVDVHLDELRHAAAIERTAASIESTNQSSSPNRVGSSTTTTG